MYRIRPRYHQVLTASYLRVREDAQVVGLDIDCGNAYFLVKETQVFRGYYGNSPGKNV